jgi:hypothetical protein
MEWWYSSTHFDLGTGWRWLVSFTCWLLYPWGTKSQQCSLNRRLGGPLSWSWHCEEKKIPQSCPSWKTNPNSLIIQPTALSHFIVKYCLFLSHTEVVKFFIKTSHFRHVTILRSNCKTFWTQLIFTALCFYSKSLY